MNRRFSDTDDSELAAWLRLSMTPGIGIKEAHNLLTTFGMPEEIFHASYGALMKTVPEKLAMLIHGSEPDYIQAQTEKTHAWLQGKG
ncbi:MAG: DNA-protecting protein DprA, partial [Oxalobacter sp.]|nr:DNA-protecting protein DprA [Oxalobacter sp.]